jgi:hypothetical protein
MLLPRRTISGILSKMARKKAKNLADAFSTWPFEAQTSVLDRHTYKTSDSAGPRLLHVGGERGRLLVYKKNLIHAPPSSALTHTSFLNPPNSTQQYMAKHSMHRGMQRSEAILARYRLLEEEQLNVLATIQNARYCGPRRTVQSVSVKRASQTVNTVSPQCCSLVVISYFGVWGQGEEEAAAALLTLAQGIGEEEGNGACSSRVKEATSRCGRAHRSGIKGLRAAG